MAASICFLSARDSFFFVFTGCTVFSSVFPYFAMACAVSYLLSGYCGLYSSQTILYSKLRAEFINVHAK